MALTIDADAISFGPGAGCKLEGGSKLGIANAQAAFSGQAQGVDMVRGPHTANISVGRANSGEIQI